MDFLEKQRLVRRICLGKLYGRITYQYENYNVVFTDPGLDLNVQADWVYKRFYEEGTQTGNLTIEESYQILINDGKWSEEKDQEIIVLKADIVKLNEQLSGTRFQKSMQKAIKTSIEKAEERITELLSIKNHLRTSTIEYLSELTRHKYIVQHIAKLEKEENKELLLLPNFQDVLRVYYFEDNGISETQIRQLARSDPWRLYWMASKDTGTSLFPHSMVEITDYQYLLVVWSKIYDFAFECSNRPNDNTINDDFLFDAWYKGEVASRNSELNKIEPINMNNGKNLGSDVFIPADKEGAKEVFELNNIEGKTRILERQKALEVSGKLQEGQLPDVKRDLIMQYNREKGNQNNR